VTGYQVMPPLDDAEYDALRASIAAGYDPARPVVVDEHGVILDGHHRKRVCDELGIDPPTVVLPGLTEDQKRDYALRVNLACRHLSREQKRALIRAELDRNPQRSDREIGRLCGVDHKTVGVVRRGEIPHPETSGVVHIPVTIEEAAGRLNEIAEAERRIVLAAIADDRAIGQLAAALARDVRGQLPPDDGPDDEALHAARQAIIDAGGEPYSIPLLTALWTAGRALDGSLPPVQPGSVRWAELVAFGRIVAALPEDDDDSARWALGDIALEIAPVMEDGDEGEPLPSAQELLP